MTKADIVNEIAKRTGVDKTSVLSTIESFMDVVKDSLANDENVYLRGFGSFIVKKRAPKSIIDPPSSIICLHLFMISFSDCFLLFLKNESGVTLRIPITRGDERSIREPFIFIDLFIKLNLDHDQDSQL